MHETQQPQPDRTPIETVSNVAEDFANKIDEQVATLNVFIPPEIQAEYDNVITMYASKVHSDLYIQVRNELTNNRQQVVLDTRDDTYGFEDLVEERVEQKFNAIAQDAAQIIRAIAGRDEFMARDDEGHLMLSTIDLAKVSAVLMTSANFTSESPEDVEYRNLMQAVSNDTLDPTSYEGLTNMITSASGNFSRIFGMAREILTSRSTVELQGADREAVKASSLMLMMSDEQKYNLIDFGIDQISNNPQSAQKYCEMIKTLTLFTDLPVISVVSKLNAKIAELGTNSPPILVSTVLSIQNDIDGIEDSADEALHALTEALTVASTSIESPVTSFSRLLGTGGFYFGALTAIWNVVLCLFTNSPISNLLNNSQFAVLGAGVATAGWSLASGSDNPLDVFEGIVSGASFSPESQNLARESAIREGTSDIVFRTNTEATKVFADDRFISTLNSMIDPTHTRYSFTLEAFKSKLQNEQPQVYEIFNREYLQKHNNVGSVTQNLVFLAHSYSYLHITDHSTFMSNLATPVMPGTEIPLLTLTSSND